MIPFPFQRHDLNVLRQANYVALLNLQTGAGKTPLTTWAMQESGARVSLVICPTQTMESAWKPTVSDIMGIEAREIGNSNKAKQAAMRDFRFGIAGVYLVSPQLLTRSDISDWSGDFLAIDEAHTLMTPKSKGQRKLSGYVARDGEPLTARFQGKLALSATSFRNRFELAWSYGRTLWPEYDGRGELADYNFVQWQYDRMDYKSVYTNRRDHNGNPIQVKQFLGEKNPGQWISECPTVITHFKRERCCDFHNMGFLPTDEPVERNEVITLLPEQKKAVRELQASMLTYIEDNPMVCDIPLTAAQRVRQVTLATPTLTYDEDDKMSVSFSDDANSPYLDRLLELLENEIEGETCAVYTESQKYAAVVVKRLNQAGITAFEYSGATRKDRDDNLKLFGTKYRVMVGVLAAAGTGLDSMQKVCKNEVWLSRDLDETVNIQAMGRLDRLSGIGQVMRWIFHDDLGISENRYGEAIARRLELNKSLRTVA